MNWSARMIHGERVTWGNDQPQASGGSHVLYWMQQAQRAHCNHALEYAIEQANALNKPLWVIFALTDAFPEANARHYRFMLEGLAETQAALRERGIPLVVRRGAPPDAALEAAAGAACLVTDCGYLRVQREWRAAVAEQAPCPVAEVESDVVVPLRTVSNKEEYAARTIRPKLHKYLNRFLVPLKPRTLRQRDWTPPLSGEDLSDIGALLKQLDIDHSVPPSSVHRGGYNAAREQLTAFLEHRLSRYASERNDPNAGAESHMSPYLHFGQIAALEIALTVQEAAESHTEECAEAYLEELVVRRELSMNYVWYNPAYDQFAGLPDWARKTLAEHAGVPREYVYDRAAWEAGDTHDPYWNAAQREMVKTGKMHNYMRMYWGKKILEWSAAPEEAFETALYLNNKYELDGRDPNSFTGVAWCFGKHDRPWAERPVFGKVRYMNAAGLRRKFDANAYAAAVDAL
ncbi:MAG: deoxyribodipyrimidine photo-lyase [Candidatus Hydrogenedentota bacterium]